MSINVFLHEGLYIIVTPAIARYLFTLGWRGANCINVLPIYVYSAGLGFEPSMSWIESQVNEPLYHDTSTRQCILKHIFSFM